MKCYHVDAFAEKVFEGNPAAVCVLDKYPSDELMLKIAIENNLSETAFAVKEGENYHLRWFTPGGEIDLCGHATLGTAFTLFTFFEKDATSITFNTMSGPLTVVRKGDLLEMDFPAYELKEVPVTPAMEDAFGVKITEAWLGRDLLCVIEDENVVRNMAPDMEKVLGLEGALLHTALGQDIYTHISQPNGHYNHLDTINRVRLHGSIRNFIREENIDNGIIYTCEKCGVPYVLGGSIRDDGPLPPVYGDVYEAQDAMRRHLSTATTVICMATMLHTIAAGNMTPSFRVTAEGSVRQVYFYCVDVSEFAINKLGDRGSLSARGIVTNVQDFVVLLQKNLSST